MQHQPVLLAEVVRLLDPKPGESYFDATAGYGGHASAIVGRIGPSARVILVDRDPQAIKALGERFDQRAQIVHVDYASASRYLVEDGSMFDLILLDLGVSSSQFDTAERGFSFSKPAPLDMRMDSNQKLTAADVVNTYSVQRLTQILKELGEEPKARQVAQVIVSHRPISTTTELAQVVGRVSSHNQATNPATRTFQALRVEVNSELEQLTEALPNFVKLLTPGGRLAIISFHSLEDRIVKQFFDTESRDCICPPKQPICTCNHIATLSQITKRPVLGSTHDASNPRARSAKLRVACKLKPKPKGGDI